MKTKKRAKVKKETTAPTNKDASAIEQASQIDWTGARDRQGLRRGLRQFLDDLHVHLVVMWGPLFLRAGVHFDSRSAARELLDFLLQSNAVDLLGLAVERRNPSKKRKRDVQARLVGLQNPLPTEEAKREEEVRALRGTD